MAQYLYKSATELARLIRAGEAKSTDIVQEHLAHIKQHNDKWNAIVILFEEEAMNTAALCDREAREGKFRGPLHGVPVTIKEQFWIKGVKSTINFNMHKDFVAPEDAVIVDRIKRSGAVVLGKTNIPKGLLDYQVSGDIYPEGKNPYNPAYSPGGSTGGGAAALAAGFTTLELGSDFGGSVRVPANFCGLYGLKPTDKTIPPYGIMPLPKNANTFIMHMAQAGPLARTMEDLELLWKIIVGPHESDRSTPRIEWRSPEKDSLSQYKVAWTDGWPGHQASQTVSDKIRGFVSSLEQQGVKAEKKTPEGNLHDETLRLYVNLFPYVIAQGNPWFIRQLIRMQFRSTFLKGTNKYLRDLRRGFNMKANHYGETMLLKSVVTERWERFFKDYDFLICPIAFGPAYKRTRIGSRLSYEGKEMPYLNYVWPYVACFNASGHPAINIPLGLDKEGLPLGVQIVGPYWSEPELINFAKLAAALTEGFVKPALGFPDASQPQPIAYENAPV